jgi:hypothetical protein
MLKSMYKTVQSCVRWQTDFSNFFECPSGLKQGCILSGINFSLFINEVAHKVNCNGKHGVQILPGLQEFFMLLFADDICLISTTPAGLQNQINNLQTASGYLGLSVNLDKTKVMVFRKGGRLSKYEKWFFNGSKIEIVNKYTYLGFTLTTKLSFNVALGEVVGRAKGRVVEILRTMWNLGTTDLCMFFKLFDAQVKPMMLYAAEVWGYAHLNTIETVHMFACKRFLNVNIRTPNIMVYGDLGRYPLYVDSTLYVIRYWLKLQKMALSRIPKQVYTMWCNRILGREGDANERHNWAYAVKQCLDLHGFSHVWIYGGVGDEKLFLKLFKQRMVDCFQQDWEYKLNNSERYETYRSFKSLFRPEKYLVQITLRKFRTAFARFRFGVNQLNINKRFTNDLVLCPSCACPETETHFLLECPLYSELREKYIFKFYRQANNFQPLLFLMQNTRESVTRSVAMFIFYALKEREIRITNFA